MAFNTFPSSPTRVIVPQSMRAVATLSRDDASSISSGSQFDTGMSIGTYTTSATSTAGRTVRFSGKVKAKKTLPLKEYTPEELSATWYDDTELEEIRLANQISFVRCHHQRTANPESCGNGSIDEINNDCYRGLEKKCQRFTNQNEAQRLSKIAVLQEQQALKKKLALSARKKKNKVSGAGSGGGGDTVDKDPSIRIAYAYSKFSKPCARESYKLALQDYKDSRLLNNTGDCNTTANGHHQKDLLGESTVCADRSKALLARRRERMRRHQVKIASMAA